MAPLRSQSTMSSTPAFSSRRQMEMPAAPAPLMTVRMADRGLPMHLAALMREASTTTAVPCWSSWNTGMSSSSMSRCSISKHRGAEISSRLMPPKPGAISCTARTISSGSLVSRQMGKASTPPKVLNRHALPSITGSAAAGPMSPRPSTAVPSVTMATILPLVV